MSPSTATDECCWLLPNLANKADLLAALLADQCTGRAPAHLAGLAFTGLPVAAALGGRRPSLPQSKPMPALPCRAPQADHNP
jgi:hypothetical protein